jgi:hypothetical protein
MDAVYYMGNKKQLGLAAQAGYGLFRYKWTNGNTFVDEKGSYYYAIGPKYRFTVKNKKVNCSVNLISPATRKNLYIDNTKKTSSTLLNNSGINIKLGFSF